MSTIIEKLAAAGHLTPEQVEEIGRNVAEMVKAAEADPALFEAFFEKNAVHPFGSNVAATVAGYGQTLGQVASPAASQGRGFWGAAKGTGQLLAGGIALATGLTLAGDVYRGARDAIMKAKRYKDMVESNPELLGKGMDRKAVQRTFNTLHNFNPDYAADPMVAGSFVKQVVDQERMNMTTVKELVDSYNTRQQSMKRDDPFTQFADPSVALSLLTVPGQAARQEEQLDINRAKGGREAEIHPSLMGKAEADAATAATRAQGAQEAVGQQAELHGRRMEAGEAYTAAQRARQRMYGGNAPGYGSPGSRGTP